MIKKQIRYIFNTWYTISLSIMILLFFVVPKQKVRQIVLKESL